MTMYLGEILVVIAVGLVATVVIPTITRLVLKEINLWRKDNTKRALDATRLTLDYLGEHFQTFVNEIEKWANVQKKYSDVIDETTKDVDEWLKKNQKE